MLFLNLYLFLPPKFILIVDKIFYQTWVNIFFFLLGKVVYHKTTKKKLLLGKTFETLKFKPA